MKRVRSQFLQSVVRLSSAVRGRGVSGGAAVAPLVPEARDGAAASSGLRPGSRSVAVGVLVAVLGVLAVAPSAGAVILTREQAGSFGPDGTPGTTFAGGLVFRLDFSQANDKLFAVVKGSANNVPASIGSFDAPTHAPSGGAFPLSVAAPGADPDIAVDNTAGATANRIYYTAENTNANPDLYGFDASGTPLGGSFPVANPIPSDICGMGIDTAANVWLGNFSAGSGSINRGVHKYDPAGVFQSKLSTAAQVTGGPCRVVFDSNNDMYVGFLFAVGVWKFTAASGYASATLIATGSTRAIKVDRTNDQLYVVLPDKVSVYDSAGTLLYEFANSIPGASFRGIAIDEGTGTVYLADSGTSNQIHVFAPESPLPEASATPTTATDVTATTANLAGVVTDNSAVATNWRIEVSRNGIDWTGVGSGQTAGGQTDAPVAAGADRLDPCSLYAFRIATNKGPGSSDVPSGQSIFATSCVKPRVPLAFAEEVTQTSATLGAHIDPEGQPTSYRFEWGPTDSYGNQAPAQVRQIGAGNDVVVATEDIDGLDPQSSYHFRVTATSPEGTTVSADREFETLNTCGLTDDRCIEMVSPPDKGPVGAAGDSVALGQEPAFQAAPDGSALKYVIAYGMPDATAGEEVSYLARRAPTGWSTVQLFPRTEEVTYSGGTIGGSALLTRTKGLSPGLDCGFYEGTIPLADDAPLEALEDDTSLLYRQDVGGDWTTVTTSRPLNSDIAQPMTRHWLIGMSKVAPFDGCQRVVFATSYRYPGVPAIGGSNAVLYSWEDGVLENVGVIPGPGGPEVAEVNPGTGPSSGPPGTGTAGVPGENYWNAVSNDASRVFFTALSKQGGDVGRQAVFLRAKGSAVAVDVSQSVTATPNNDTSSYQTASVDGSKMFFTGRSGLAPNDPVAGPAACTEGPTDRAGCDLYLYSVGGDGIAGTGDDSLTDLSVPGVGVSNSGGAGVAGVLGASDDGEVVYFAARGQLVAGEGRTEAQNLASDSFSVYVSDGGSIGYVGTVGERDSRALIRSSNDTGLAWTSRVTPDGRQLLFGSTANPTDYDSGGLPEAYLYSLDTDTLECVSCRRDLEPSVGANGVVVPLLPDGSVVENRLSPPLTLTDDGTRVFFVSRNRLAVGATEGRHNLYQWERGQVSFISGSADSTSYRGGLRFAGASASGDDIYFATVDQRSWKDTDSKMDIYDARVGSAADSPPDQPEPCSALVDGSCQEDGASASDAVIDTAKSGEPEAGVSERMVVGVRGLTRRQRGRLVATGRAVVLIRVNRPGKVAVRGTARIAGFRTRVLAASTVFERAGLHRVPVSLSRPARRYLRKAGVLRIRMAVTAAGASRGQVLGLTLHRVSKRPGKSDRRNAK